MRDGGRGSLFTRGIPQHLRIAKSFMYEARDGHNFAYKATPGTQKERLCVGFAHDAPAFCAAVRFRRPP